MTKISAMTTIPSVDRATDLLEIVDASDLTQSFKTTVNGMLGFTGGNPTSTTDTQTLTNKTLTSPTINTPTLTVLDSALTIQDNSDNTKQAQFQLSGITTATTRTYTLPDRSDTLVDLGSTQTLTSKTLTAPTITNPTLTVDTISEFTGANGVTIDGLNIKDSALTTANSVPNSVMSNTGSFSSAWATTAWVPTQTGFSADPASGVYLYSQIGKLVHLFIRQPNSGTSNATTFTISLPVTARTVSNLRTVSGCSIVNNGTTQTTPGAMEISSGGTVLNVYMNFDLGSTLWTNSGGKRLAAGEIIYEAA